MCCKTIKIKKKDCMRINEKKGTIRYVRHAVSIKHVIWSKIVYTCMNVRACKQRNKKWENKDKYNRRRGLKCLWNIWV